MPAVSRRNPPRPRPVPIHFEPEPRTRPGSARVEDMRPLLALFPANASRRRNRPMHINAEVGTMRAACRFTVWAMAQQKFPTPEAVVNRFQCSRATSYRWLNALADALGIEPPWRAPQN